MFSHQTSIRKPSYPSLHTPDGQRKYLNEDERNRVIECAKQQENSVKQLCLVLLLSGCRLTEALSLSKDSILGLENAILIRSLKKRDKISYRQIPLPHAIITGLLVLGQQCPDRLSIQSR